MQQHAADQDVLSKLTELCGQLLDRLKHDKDQLALREAVNGARLKIIAEIARDDRIAFNKLAMNRYKHFPKLPAPFAERWAWMKTQLNITEEEKLLSRMENDAASGGNAAAHEHFTHSYQELVAVAHTMPNSNYYLFFLALNQRLNALRPGDGLFTTQEKAFVVE